MSRQMLSWIAVLDSYGAAAWNLRVVAVVAFVVLLGIRRALGKKRGVEWYALVHAIISSSGAVICTYLDIFASERVTGTPEPLRACIECAGPLTSLHRLMPAITLGYSAFDFIDGVTISFDFALHGLATFFVMLYFIEAGAPQFVTPYLLMEVSTLNLTVVKADFFSDFVAAANQACFVLSFFAFRIVLTPYMWFQLMVALYEHASSETFRNCYPHGLGVVSCALGMVFHVLNSYWFYKILRKAKRKLAGKEAIKANNDFVDDIDKSEGKKNR